MTRHADIRPNMLDRLFLRLDGLQGPSSMNLYALGLSGMPDLEILKVAIADLLAEQPLLRTRVRAHPLGYRRRAVAVEPVDGILTLGADDGATAFESATERAFMRHRVDLASEAPFRLLLRPFGTGARVVAGIHHSVADGIGGYFVLDRLAAHYAARLGGELPEPAPAAPSRRYGAYFRRLDPAERRAALRGAARSFKDLVAPPLTCATFSDVDLPASGEFAWRELTLPTDALAPLKARARALGGTLNDLLLAAVARAGAATWPDPAGLPHQVLVPASMRDGAATDPTNRVGELRFAIPAVALSAFDATFAVVSRFTPLARDRARAFERVLQNGLVSHFPPALIKRVVLKSLATPDNQTLTFVFSNTGVLDPQPRDFGPIRVETVAGMPPLTMPPGFGVVAATARGRLTLTIAWSDPALLPDRVSAFMRALEQELAAQRSPTPSVPS